MVRLAVVVLTDNGQRLVTHLATIYSVHMYDRVCGKNGIEHRLTKPNNPWANVSTR